MQILHSEVPDSLFCLKIIEMRCLDNSDTSHVLNVYFTRSRSTTPIAGSL